MGASKDFPITDHDYVPCGCGDPDCRYCAECKEQEHFHQPAAPSGPRDVPLDEVFTWKEDFLDKVREAFGGLVADASPLTYGDLRSRCDKIDRELDPFFEHVRSLAAPFDPGLQIHMVKPGVVPDGVLRRCTCKEKEDPT